MKACVSSREARHNTKQKLLAAIALLLISAIVLGGASFAWITLSTAPEVRGISTNISANGSLEIALLNADTRADLDKIDTLIGQSLAGGAKGANNTWGNLVDLSDEGYGLSNITLLPARLNAVEANDGYMLNAGLLSVPTYGHDGRIIDLTDNTVSAVYREAAFSYIMGKQDYGVRAIGTANTISVQASALAMAQGNIKTYQKSANDSAKAAIDQNGVALMNIVLTHSLNADATYDNTAVETLKSLLKSLNQSAEFIDLALRQSVIAYAASAIGNKDEFTQARNAIMNTSLPLSSILEESPLYIPSAVTDCLSALEKTQNDINGASNTLKELSGDTYTWDELRAILDKLINLDKIFIDGKKFTEMSKEDFTQLTGKTVKMRLPSGSGVFADIADFAGDYSTFITVPLVGTVEMETLTEQGKNPYLTAVSEKVDALAAADGSTAGEVEVELTQMYGYALDLAFRCNAPLSSLLLQTDPRDRIYEDSFSPSTMGGGSYMEFTSLDEKYTFQQQIALMDAVRVAFVDDKNTVLGIAKLNTSSYTASGGAVKAPLYLYEYSFSEEEDNYGALIMGERRKTDNTIVALEQNAAKAVTVLVWLDGDIVNNKMLSAESDTSLNGTLNIQFASSANLIPAGNNDLLTATPDKADLSARIESYKELYKAGQGMHTTVSWKAFAGAYENAVSVRDDMQSNDMQVLKASLALTKAKLALEEISLSVLGEMIDSLRDFMGKTNDPARYVLHDAEGERYYSVASYTEEQKAAMVGTVYRVDYNNNLRDEGNGVRTAVYTDESWSRLAAALYDAEVVYTWNNYTDYKAVDAALTAMEVAYDTLQLRVFFVPYEYEDVLYYRAVTEYEDADAYGKWYDANFKRILNELLILELDARATVAKIAAIEPGYVNNQSALVSAYVDVLDDVYPTLKSLDILAIHWSANENFIRAITNSQRVYLQSLIGRATALSVAEDEVADAKALLERKQTETTRFATEAEAAGVITALEAKVIAEEKRIAAIETPVAPEDDMTADQRTLLTAAVTAAKAVKDYNDDTVTALAELRGAVATVEALLAQESGATVQAANVALDALNEQLKANGQKEVTAYNTLTHSIPMGSEVFEPVYSLDETNFMFFVKEGFFGDTTLSATVLTRNGVILTVERTVTVYAPIADVRGDQPEVMAAGTSADMSITLVQNELLTEEDLAFGEAISKCTWASADSSILRVSPSGDGAGVIKAISAGTTDISVAVQTKQGNTYTFSFTVTVYAPAQGVEIRTLEAPEGTSDNELSVGASAVLSAELLQNEALEEGELTFGEAILSYAWASASDEIVSVASQGDTCTVSAAGVGATYITVTVETDRGNVYTSSLRVTVTK